MSLHTLMFGWEYPPFHSGGLGVACQGLVRGLLQQGVKVTLVLPSNRAEADDNLSILSPTKELSATVRVFSDLQPYDGWASYEDRLRGSKIPTNVEELYGPDLGHAVHRFTELAVTLTKDTKPDVIHCHDWMTYEAGKRAAAYHRCPLVTHIHATEFDRTDFHPNRWIADRERSGLMAADRVIAVSAYTKNILVDQYGIPASKISVVHNGHQQLTSSGSAPLLDRYGPRHIPLVLFLGRLTVQKNPWQFLEVARRVCNHRSDVQFVMAGDGPMLTQLIERACELGLTNNIIFTGKVDRSEVRALYERADCFVMPSLSEPFGLVALEAIAHGTPVILSKQSGAAEVIDHAFKVDYWDSDKMADCILTILREQPLAEQLIAEAPRVLERLSWRNQAGNVRSIYQQLLSQI